MSESYEGVLDEETKDRIQVGARGETLEDDAKNGVGSQSQR